MQIETLSGALASFLLGYIKVAVFMALIVGALLIILEAGTRIKHRHRRRKMDARIIRQAKAAGVWEKPQALGGRALEIYAWEFCRLKRLPGEPDKELRRRCMAAGFSTVEDADRRKAK